jgi:hypothetical protein
MTDALVPVEEREVQFYDDRIVAVSVDVAGRRQVYVPLRPIVEALGLNWSGQLQRLRRDSVLNEVSRFVCVTHTDSTGGDPEVVAIPIEFLNGWLFGVSASRVKEELREKVLRYQKECYRILWQTFNGSDDGAVALAQVRGLALAVAQLAQDQLRTREDVEMNFQALVSLNRRISDLEVHVYGEDDSSQDGE